MFCALLGQDIMCAFTGPLVLWFLVAIGLILFKLAVARICMISWMSMNFV